MKRSFWTTAALVAIIGIGAGHVASAAMLTGEQMVNGAIEGGALGTSWALNQSDGTVTYDTTTFSPLGGSTASAKITDLAVSSTLPSMSQTLATVVTGTNADTLTFSFDFRFGSTATKYWGIAFESADTYLPAQGGGYRPMTNAIKIRPSTNGIGYESTGGVSSNVQSTSGGALQLYSATWYHMELIFDFDAKTFTGSITNAGNGNALGSWANGIFHSPATSLRRLAIVDTETSANAPLFIDNVSLMAPIPEPATLSLMALAGLMAWPRRRRA